MVVEEYILWEKQVVAGGEEQEAREVEGDQSDLGRRKGRGRGSRNRETVDCVASQATPEPGKNNDYFLV